MKQQQRSINCLVGCGVILAALLCVLCGCSGGHQIISASESCISCHQEKTTYDLDAGSVTNAITTASPFTVQTDASRIVICKPIFVSEDGTHYVPESLKNVSVNNGSTEIELSDGMYAICIDQGGTSTGSVVIVDSSCSESATISL